jgi:probable HAF family extracellular repeat protein
VLVIHHVTAKGGRAMNTRTRSMLFVALFGAAGPAVAQSFDGLGLLPGGTFSLTYGVSAGGTVVVGYGNTSGNTSRGFRWTRTGGLQVLGALPGGSATLGLAVSADGAVCAGQGQSTFGWRACRWAGAAAEDLGSLGGGSQANAVNSDGAVVVGWAVTATGIHAFRWTSAGGMQDLGALPGALNSYAYAVSGDGSVVVGYGETAGGGSPHAFRWTSVGGMEDLGTLAGSSSVATGASADGSVIVGDAYSGGGFAWRWTRETGMVSLGALPGDASSTAADVSADGSTVVGMSTGGAGGVPFIWTQERGIEDLEARLQSLGLNLAGWTDGMTVSAVSTDGLAITGYARYNGGNDIGWVATLGSPCYANCDGSTVAPILNINDFVCFSQQFAAADTRANCDGSTTPPLLNVNDFVCFQQRLAAGCP